MAKRQSIDALRTTILDCSFNAFCHNGYAGVPLEEVAKELRISKKTIYKVFTSKEELLETSIQRALDKIGARTAEGISGKMSVKELLLLFSKEYNSFQQFIPPVLWDEIRKDLPYISDKIEWFRKENFFKPFSKMLKHLRSKNLTNYPSPTRSFVHTFFALLEGTMEADHDQLQAMVVYIARGISTKEHKKKN